MISPILGRHLEEIGNQVENNQDQNQNNQNQEESQKEEEYIKELESDIGTDGIEFRFILCESVQRAEILSMIINIETTAQMIIGISQIPPLFNTLNINRLFIISS